MSVIEINLESAIPVSGPANPRKQKAFAVDVIAQKGGRFTVTKMTYERLGLESQGFKFSQLLDKRIVAIMVPEGEASALNRKAGVTNKGRAFTDRRLAGLLNVGEHDEVGFNLEPTNYPNAFVVAEVRRVNTQTNQVTETAQANSVQDEPAPVFAGEEGPEVDETASPADLD